MGEALAGETPLWGRFSPRQARRFSLGYTNTLISDGAQSANSLLAKSSRQRPLFVVVAVVVVFTLKTVLTSIQYLLFLTLKGKETNSRGHKLTQNKV